MLEFLNQYGWYFIIFGLMFVMHRRGAGGCCGGHQQGKKDQQDQRGTKDPISFEQKK
ncbi:DUF2933 domain-containing protein [Desulfosporosinus fructosivorans]|uniref:DUF2933 domain-containing protein n=1 Tax=Desulfosporosinus fructosivorans TaxID=2018669 RepID=A0A4Z0R4Z8_9FIRM|nr:DUF2933 domain-containing protein [Desulfosporosinus fructosivorans]TGE37233.1 DUF2933 domain-containing protein [Desulfosporosinus fructosivorans]